MTLEKEIEAGAALYLAFRRKETEIKAAVKGDELQIGTIPTLRVFGRVLVLRFSATVKQ